MGKGGGEGKGEGEGDGSVVRSICTALVEDLDLVPATIQGGSQTLITPVLEIHCPVPSCAREVM